MENVITVPVPTPLSHPEIIGADTLGLNQSEILCPSTTLYRSKGS